MKARFLLSGLHAGSCWSCGTFSAVGSGLGTNSPPMRTVAFLGIRDWQFRGFVFPGDTIRVRAKVLAKGLRGRGKRGEVVWHRALVNQELVPVQVQYAKAWRVQQGDLGGAATRISALQAQAEPADLLGVLRHDLQLAVAQYDYRAAIRSQQQVVYALAVDQGLEDQVSGLLPTSDLPPLRQTTEALRALWRAAGIGDFSQVAIRHNRKFQDSAPVGQLLGYYRASGAHYGIDWTFLASINFIESDFGRVNGPSSAGAMGPMQFMPGTWASYGVGDIMSPRDSIDAAARYLKAMGGPGNMPSTATTTTPTTWRRWKVSPQLCAKIPAGSTASTTGRPRARPPLSNKKRRPDPCGPGPLERGESLSLGLKT